MLLNWTFDVYWKKKWLGNYHSVTNGHSNGTVLGKLSLGQGWPTGGHFTVSEHRDHPTSLILRLFDGVFNLFFRPVVLSRKASWGTYVNWNSGRPEDIAYIHTVSSLTSVSLQTAAGQTTTKLCVQCSMISVISDSALTVSISVSWLT